MVLINEDESKFPIKDSPLQKEFKARLDSQKVKIFYQINAKQDKIRYYAYDDFFGVVAFEATDSKIVTSIDQKRHNYCMTEDEYESILNTFVRYIIETDKTSSEEMLKKRYGSLYDSMNLFKNMTSSEIQRYKKDKEELQNLLLDLDKKEDTQDTIVKGSLTEAGKYSLKLAIDDLEEFKDALLILYKSNKMLVTESLTTLYKNYFLKKPYLFTQEQKDILTEFLPFYIAEATNRGYYTSNIDEETAKEIVFKILLAIAKQKPIYSKPIEIMGSDYDIDTEVIDLDVSIDADGNIQTTEFLADDLIVCKKNKMILGVDEVGNKLTLYRYKNEKMRKLFLFKHENPNFSTQLFLKEISTSLIPKIKDEVQIENHFLSDSLRSIDHIEYYVDLDKENMELLCKTICYLDKKEVTLDEFSTKYETRVNAFLSELNKLDMKADGEVLDQDVIVMFINAPLAPLQSQAQLFISEELKKLKKKPIGKINISIASENDWFSVDFQSDEYSKEEIDSIINAYKKKKKYFLLKGNILSLEEEGGEDLKEILDDFDFKNENIPIYQALKLTDKKNVDLSQPIKQLFDDVSHYDEKELRLSDDLKPILRPYQLKGIQWLSTLKEHHLSGILADDMGLGKTLEMIAFLSQYDEKKPNLIITPKSLTFNWEDEFHRWNKEAKVVVLSLDKEERHRLIKQIKKDETVNYIISYESLRIDLDLFKVLSFSFVILDEGQNIANALSQKARAVKSIDADYKFALTGTPIQNSLMDLWSLFDFLMPGYLKSFNEFRKQYAKYDIDEKERQHLEHIVSPFLLKRKKDDVLKELPGKTTITQSLLMDEKERDLYNAYLLKAKNTFQAKNENGKTKKIEVLSALTRLRQICVDPSSFLEYTPISSKLDYTLFLIKEAVLKGHKVLLFSSFKTILLHLASLLEKEQITFDTITGDTSAAKRLEIAKSFNQNPDPKVMLISLKAGGTGLNLIGADIVVHLDPWWNLAAEDQASDRAYRIGQKRKVTIYKIVMKNTIEEKVLSLQEKKKNLSDIFDNANEKTNLNDEDIAYLLS